MDFTLTQFFLEFSDYIPIVLSVAYGVEPRTFMGKYSTDVSFEIIRAFNTLQKHFQAQYCTNPQNIL